MTQPGDMPEFEDLDVVTRDEELAEEPETPTRSSIFQPAPMALSGLIIACVSFLSNVPIDNAIDARLYQPGIHRRHRHRATPLRRRQPHLPSAAPMMPLSRR